MGFASSHRTHRRGARGRDVVPPRAGAEMTTGAGDRPADPPIPADTGHDSDPPLPEPAWQKLVPVAAAALAAIRPDDLPGPLRRFARFAPAKRAKLAAEPLRAALAGDPVFRQRIADVVSKDGSELTRAGDADVVTSAARAYLFRGDDWRDEVAGAARRLADQEAAEAVENRIAAAEQRAAAAAHDAAIAEREAEKLRVEVTELRAEAADLRRRHHQGTKELREVKRRERKLTDALSSERGRLKQAEENHKIETRRLKSQLDDTVKALERARRGARDARSLNESRLWLLLETIGGAAQGLRRELALEPSEQTPADFVAGKLADQPGGSLERARGLDADDPIRLDQLLGMPQAHMIVDGYNVTIGGWPEITLEQQRARLIRGLSGLAAQSGAEVTVVFDGAERVVGLPPAPRGVRVLFSRKGQTADDVIRGLVRNEPNGRPVIVISSDREVADGTRRHGAYPLSSETLLRRLSRA